MPTTVDDATSNESAIPHAAKRKWSRRKKIIVSSITVSLIVVAGIFTYISSLGIGGCGCSVPLILTDKSSDANNWIWTISSTGAPILKSDVCVQLKNASGFVIQNVPLTAASGTHGFKYTASTSGDYIHIGEVLSLSRDYLQGCEITLVTPSYSGQYAVLTV